MYRQIVTTHDEALIHLFFHCCMKDGAMNDPELDTVSDMIVSAGLNKGHNLRAEYLNYKEYRSYIKDETRYLLEEFRKTFKGLRIVNLEQEAKGIPGKKYPLSMGIKESKHEILLLTDADCVPATEHWLAKMQDGYDDNTEVVLGYGAYYKKPGLLNRLVQRILGEYY